MKLTTRIAKEEIREQAASITAAIAAQPDMPYAAREYLVAHVLEEMERIANHAFAEGRLFERRNPISA